MISKEQALSCGPQVPPRAVQGCARFQEFALGLPRSCWLPLCPEYIIQPFLFGWPAAALGRCHQETLLGQGS